MDHARPDIPAASASPRDLLRAAYQARERHEIEPALEAIGHAARLAPDDAAIALADAHLHHDGWRPAVEKFDRAVALAPGDLSAIKGLAGALDRSGGSAAGRALLDKSLTHHPGWIEGHKLLSTMRLTAGEHVLELIHYEAAGYPALQLLWTPPGGEASPLPQRQLVAKDPGLVTSTDPEGHYRFLQVPAAVGALQVTVGDGEGKVTSEPASPAQGGTTELKAVRVRGRRE